ncbi:MAG TPA: L,D-transpeptidase [Gammaproteobacteria bacterium]|nr:L,D-transpeptidase [Gammaproteobacteria bacterium]
MDRSTHTHRRQIIISISRQKLTLLNHNGPEREYPVSTALNGAGEQLNSGCTPRGRHKVRLVIGKECPLNTVFVGRRANGEIYTDELGRQQPQRDWILTRILWLTGDESGINRGGECDTLKRYIYIHGTPDSEPIGEPLSHGCIRMHNRDIVDLCELAGQGTEVIINE